MEEWPREQGPKCHRQGKRNQATGVHGHEQDDAEELKDMGDPVPWLPVFRKVPGPEAPEAVVGLVLNGFSQNGHAVTQPCRQREKHDGTTYHIGRRSTRTGAQNTTRQGGDEE
eukprot:CAMPEP_0115251022 /NCGR_PEP_ID=MMETSP0270-20121206/43412_1 /TAXON_ID=71861 /ORGANISM="Scrippsiella trochoidea, Strain CCMP3099" /LENGTH=112 /DNA_ID=CAMNT_0002666423 /DNA_START=469 /DNA_END=807 /DNA_ORIENTATION=+